MGSIITNIQCTKSQILQPITNNNIYIIPTAPKIISITKTKTIQTTINQMSKSLAINTLIYISFLSIIHISFFINLTECKILTQEDYTLYFDEYTFDWSNADDWHVITADNTPSNGLKKGTTKIVACTLHVKGMKKNLCVHTKAEGGFTLKFQDFPHIDSRSSFKNVKMPDIEHSAHQDLENDFEQFLKSQYDSNEDAVYDIELDFLNDDDWNEINAIWNWNINDKFNNQQNQNQQQYNDQHQDQENYQDMNSNDLKNDYYDQFYQQLQENNNNAGADFGAHPQHRRLIDSDMNEDQEEFLVSIKRLFRRRYKLHNFCHYPLS